MKRYLTFTVLALSWLAPAVTVHAEGGWPGPIHLPGRVTIGGNLYVNTHTQAAQAGPWYLYWPLEAHFNVPAPTGYPYWPSPMALPGMGGAAGMGGPAPVGPALTPTPIPAAPTPAEPPLSPSAFQPARYSVPTYWYGR